MKWIIYVLVFITAELIVIIINNLFFNRKRQVKERLENIQSMTPILEDEEALKQPLADRIIKPVYKSILRFIGNVAPRQIREKYENIINFAGLSKSVTFTRVIAIQIMFALLAAGVLYMISSKGGKSNITLILGAGILAFLIPLSFIRTKADQRRKNIKRSLPDLLDLLYISVEAGLSFDMALKKTSEKMLGPLSEEITKTLEEINKGRNRQDALRGMVKRTGVEDLSYFVTSVIQTELLGSNIANMLRIQSKTMRQKRRQRAEEAAAKISVRMLIPLVFLIFPSLFIVVLGPAMIRIIDTLGNLF